MKREYFCGVLFFGGLWGLSEAILGDALYTAGAAYASIPLTVIALAILSLSGAYLPRAGTATLIACFAMLYKFLNTPFFACHLLGIVLTGFCFDLFFHILKLKNRSLAAGLAVYSSYVAFALMITYIARYAHWVQGGFAKVFRYIVLDGSVAALACAIVVPLAASVGARVAAAAPEPFRWRASPLTRGVTALTVVVWLFGVVGLVSNCVRPG